MSGKNRVINSPEICKAVMYFLDDSLDIPFELVQAQVQKSKKGILDNIAENEKEFWLFSATVALILENRELRRRLIAGQELDQATERFMNMVRKLIEIKH